MTGRSPRPSRPAVARFVVAAAGAGLALAAACSRPAPAAAPVPEAMPSPNLSTARAPTAVAGDFSLSAVIQGRTIPAPQPPPRPRGRTVTAPVPSLLHLSPSPVAAPDAAVPSGTQLLAGVSLPGYTMPPRGRTTQAAAWWPGMGDSITVRWVTPRKAAVWLRGVLRGDTLSGDVWYTMLETGNEFQLGSFRAVRQPVRRRTR